MGFYFLYLIIKIRSCGFYAAVNPGILYGGITLEGKNEVDKLLPIDFIPKSILIIPGTPMNIIKLLLEDGGIKIPCYVKPDNGYRGKMVQFIETESELISYAGKADFNFLIQEYIDYKNEIGLFYYRFPNEDKGHISGIVFKRGIIVIGDGIQTIGNLVLSNYRYHKLYDEIFLNKGKLIDYIPTLNEEIVLSEIGNHIRGATFYDMTYKISLELENKINHLCKQIKGFNYGRFDIKFSNWEDLEQGKNFKIIELNGAAGEPTHIYDSSYSYFKVLKEMKRHWKIMGIIAQQNHQKGHPYISCKISFRLFRDYLFRNK